MSRKERSATADKSLTVSEYCRQFFERTVNNELSNGSGASDHAGQKFLNLIRKLQEAGSKDDVKLPLRLLRDEIGRTYFASARQRSEKIEVLFKLYDTLEAGAQEDARASDSRRSAAGNQILEELRQRFTRLVIGDTWDAWPELKLLALRRMHTYAILEKQQAREAVPITPPPTPSGGRLGMKMLSRTLSGASSSSVAPTWQAAIDDFSKAPGSRLLPMIKLLLLSTADIPEETKTGLAEEAKEAAAAASNGGGARDASIEELRPQPSGFSEAADISRRVTGLDMDDLLGLNEAPDEENTTQKEVEAKAEEAGPDPFAGTPRALPDAMPSVFDSQAAPKGAQGGPMHMPGYPAVSHTAPHHLHSHSSGPINYTYSQSGSLTPQPSSNPPLSPRMLPSHVSLEAQQSNSRTYFDPSAFEKNTFRSQGSYPPPGVMLASVGSGNLGNLQRADSSGPPSAFGYGNTGGPMHHTNSSGQAANFNAGQGNLQRIDSNGLAGGYHPNPGHMQRLGSSGLAGGYNGASTQRMDSSGQPVGFNPFGLSSPTAAAPADDAFATFSPLQPPPPPPVPQPMRAPPQPPASAQQDTGLRQQHSHGGPSNSLSAW